MKIDVLTMGGISVISAQLKCRSTYPYRVDRLTADVDEALVLFPREIALRRLM